MPVKRSHAAEGRMLRLWTVKVKGFGEFDVATKEEAKALRNEYRNAGKSAYLTVGPDHANFKRKSQ